MNTQLILASQSPRRRQLIQLLGFPVQLVTADVDERSITEPDPALNVVKTAELKARTIQNHLLNGLWQPGTRSILVAADTTVALEGQQLGKPADPDEAWQMLAALRGCTHEVHTGLFLIDLSTGQETQGVQTTTVTMRRYSDAEIAAYVATGDPMDKAGAYAIQHPVFSPVAQLQGCYLGVVGLSLCHLLQLLQLWGITADKTAVLQAHQGYPCEVGW